MNTLKKIFDDPTALTYLYCALLCFVAAWVTYSGFTAIGSLLVVIAGLIGLAAYMLRKE